jgi:membrane dipeptidase
MDRSSGALDLERGNTYRRYCQFFAIYTQDDMAPGKTAVDVYEEQYALFCRQMAEHADAAVHCRTGEDARRAHEAGKIAAFLSVEGAHSLGCDLDQLRKAYDRGVRAVNLTWNNPNALSGTNCQEADRGLSDQGRAFVREMQRLGMLVDVSHLSDPGFWDVIEMAQRPIMASHSNARALCPHPRNLTDAQFTAIIKNQGVVGLNLCREFVGGREDLDGLIAHLEHFLALGGEKTVALGGDLDGCTPVDGVDDVTGWKSLYERLLQRNYKESVVQDLFYNNMMRVVNDL